MLVFTAALPNFFTNQLFYRWNLLPPKAPLFALPSTRNKVPGQKKSEGVSKNLANLKTSIFSEFHMVKEFPLPESKVREMSFVAVMAQVSSISRRIFGRNLLTRSIRN